MPPNNISQLFQEGEKLLNKDDKQAFSYFKQIADEENYSQAQLRVGTMYYEGKGVERNVNLAIECLEKAAKQGLVDEVMKRYFQVVNQYNDPKAKSKLTALLVEQGKKYLKQDGDRAILYFLQAVRLNPQQKPELTALFTDEGKKYLDQNPEKAFKYFSQAVKFDKEGAMKKILQIAEEANADMQFYIGQMYERGDGVTRDVTTAIGWYEKATRQNHSRARLPLMLLRFDEGKKYLAHNHERAFEYFKKTILVLTPKELYPAVALATLLIIREGLKYLYQDTEKAEKYFTHAIKTIKLYSSKSTISFTNDITILLIEEGLKCLYQDTEKAGKYFSNAIEIVELCSSEREAPLTNEILKLISEKWKKYLEKNEEKAFEHFTHTIETIKLCPPEKLPLFENKLLKSLIAEGKKYLDQNPEKAFRCFTHAIEARKISSPEKASFLAINLTKKLIAKGKKYPKRDKEQAFEYFKLANEITEGYAPAQFYITLMRENGQRQPLAKKRARQKHENAQPSKRAKVDTVESRKKLESENSVSKFFISKEIEPQKKDIILNTTPDGPQ